MIPARHGRVLYVSRSAPPGKSGSAHVLKELLAADGGQRLQAVGSRSLFSRRPEPSAPISLLPTEISLFGRGARFFALLRQCLLPLLSRRLAAMAGSPEVDSIVCVFPDALYCEAALAAADRCGKPISFYFHNTYADNRSGIAGRHARRLEARMIARADRLLFISDALRDCFVAKYPGIEARSEVVRHPVPSATNRGQPRGFASQPVHATLIGNLNHSNLDAATRMIRALAPRDDIRIRLCTPVPRLLLMARGMDLDRVEYLGYVPDADMPAILENTDLFLLPHGLDGGYSAQEYQTIFPTRAAHYLAQGRPILAHCPTDSGLARFLLKHGCAQCVGVASEDALVAAFEALSADGALQWAMAQRAFEASKLFEPSTILQQLAVARQVQA